MMPALSALMLLAAGVVPGVVERPEATMVVAVLDRSIEAGDLLAASDLIDAPRAPGVVRGALRARDIVGMEAAHRLAAGGIVHAGDLVRPQLVRRGEPVSITVRSGPLVIGTTGRALASGAAGAIVRVVIQSTNRTLDGEVEGPGAVRVVAN